MKRSFDEDKLKKDACNREGIEIERYIYDSNTDDCVLANLGVSP